MGGRKAFRERLYNYVKNNQGCSTGQVYDHCYENWPRTTPMRTAIGNLLSMDERLVNVRKGNKNGQAEWTLVKQETNN